MRVCDKMTGTTGGVPGDPGTEPAFGRGQRRFSTTTLGRLPKGHAGAGPGREGKLHTANFKKYESRPLFHSQHP